MAISVCCFIPLSNSLLHANQLKHLSVTKVTGTNNIHANRMAE
jgi:hypothetical protein